MSARTWLRAACAVLSLCAAAAFGQAYPNRPVTLVIPATPGGITDQLGRMISTRLAERLGQPVVLDYKPGAGGSVAAEFVSKAAPDGYTLLVGTQGTQLTNRYLYRSLRYDADQDFTPVHGLVALPNVVVVNAAKPWRTMKDLADAARQQPDRLSVGTPGNGTAAHLGMELFAGVSGLKLVHAPYKGSSPAITDLLGGNIDIAFDYAATTLSHVQAGKLRALAVSSPTRLPSLPQVPTMAEQGHPGAELVAWVGLFFPAKTPPAAVDRWQQEVARVLQEPAAIEAITRMGAAPLMQGGPAYAAFIQREHGKWKDLIQRLGLKPE